MTVAKIMSRTPVMVEPQVPLREIYRLMAEHGIRHIPVVSSDGLVGIISEWDVREALPSPTGPAEATEFAAAMDRILVWEVMAEEVVTVTPRTSLAQAAHLLAGRKIGCLPVLAVQVKREGEAADVDTEGVSGQAGTGGASES